MYHAVFNRVLAKDVHCSLGLLLSLALFTLQCRSSLSLRDQFMDSHHVRSVRYDFFCIPLRVLHYFKLLICTLGTDVNIKKIVYCYKRGVSVWVFFFVFLKVSFSGKLLSCFTFNNADLNAWKAKWQQKITRIFAQNLGQAPKEAEFYSFSNEIQCIFSHYETIWIALELTSVTENPLANQTKSWCLQWQRLANFSNFRTGEEAMVWCGTPVMTGLFFRARLTGTHRRTDRIQLGSAKTAWGKSFHPNQSEG